MSETRTIGIGTNVYKPIDTTEKQHFYADCAAWCNLNGAMMVDKGNYYEVVAIPEPTLDERKVQKLNELNVAHKTAESDARVVSSFGFTIDANDRANRDIDGILKTIGDGTVMFCDYENQFHELNRSQCETLQIEIIQNAQALYAQKWAYRTQVETAESVEELELLEFTFSNLCF